MIMNDKVLSLIKEAEAHYQELQEDRPVRLMPFDKRKDLVIHYNFIAVLGNHDAEP